MTTNPITFYYCIFHEKFGSKYQISQYSLHDYWGNKGAFPDSKVHGTNMEPTWVLSAPDGPMLAPWTLLSGYILENSFAMHVS